MHSGNISQTTMMDPQANDGIIRKIHTNHGITDCAKLPERYNHVACSGYTQPNYPHLRLARCNIMSVVVNFNTYKDVLSQQASLSSEVLTVPCWTGRC